MSKKETVIRPGDRFIVVVDATPDSGLSDILFECDLARLRLQFLGGLSMAEKPTIYTSIESTQAFRDARKRLDAARADIQKDGDK